MQREDLTAVRVRNIKPPKTGRIEIADGVARGLTLRVSSTGKKTWAMAYRVKGAGGANADGKALKGPMRRMTLGQYPALNLADARTAAAKALARANAGHDPAREEATELVTRHATRQHTVQVAVDNFIEHYAKPFTKQSGQTEALFRNHVLPRWGNRPVAGITTKDAKALRNEIAAKGTPHAAAEVLKHTRKFFNWLIDEEVVDANPMAELKPPVPPTERERELSADEVTQFWAGAGTLGYPFSDFVRLLLLTACRRNEIARMKWDWINGLDGDDPYIQIPGSEYKTGKAFIVPLSPMAVDILRGLPRFEDGPYVFSTMGGKRPISGFSKAKTSLDTAIAKVRAETGARGDMPGWVLHDLRRTARSILSRLRVPFDVAEMCLGHKLPKVARTYNRHDYYDEKREAFTALADRVALLTAPNEKVAVLTR